MYLLEFLNAIRNIGTQYTYIAGDPCDLVGKFKKCYFGFRSNICA